MRSVQIKNVPDDVARVLRTRAAKAGQSQQEYLLEFLVDAARHPTLDEIYERARQRYGGRLSPAFAVEAQRADRDSR
jgi:Fe2+ or Zn2+ uptake regulation protein